MVGVCAEVLFGSGVGVTVVSCAEVLFGSGVGTKVVACTGACCGACTKPAAGGDVAIVAGPDPDPVPPEPLIGVGVGVGVAVRMLPTPPLPVIGVSVGVSVGNCPLVEILPEPVTGVCVGVSVGVCACVCIPAVVDCSLTVSTLLVLVSTFSGLAPSSTSLSVGVLIPESGGTTAMASVVDPVAGWLDSTCVASDCIASDCISSDCIASDCVTACCGLP